jgi:hypothetical protein
MNYESLISKYRKLGRPISRYLRNKANQQANERRRRGTAKRRSPYKILHNVDWLLLEVEVNKYLMDGYKLHGALTIYGKTFFQPVVMGGYDG